MIGNNNWHVTSKMEPYHVATPASVTTNIKTFFFYFEIVNINIGYSFFFLSFLEVYLYMKAEKKR